MRNIPLLNDCDLLDNQNDHNDCVLFKLEDIITLKNNLVSKNHHHQFYQVLFITAGNGTHYIENQEFETQKGDLFFLAPGLIHRWSFNDKIQGFVLNFTADFFSSFLVDKNFIPNLPIFSDHRNKYMGKVKKDFAPIRDIFEKIRLAYLNKNRNDLNLLHIHILELLLTSVKPEETTLESRKNDEHHHNFIKRYEDLIDKNFRELRFPKDYAQILSVTPNYLNLICTKFKGISSGELVRNRIILECKRYLINTDLSISQIAFELNFKDNSYFSRFFKSAVGVSPDQYRRR